MSWLFTRFIALLYMKSDQIDYEKRHYLGLRDLLFERYIDCLDKLDSWRAGKIDVACQSKSHKATHRRTMIKLLETHRREISEELVQLDDKITALAKARDLYTELSEIY